MKKILGLLLIAAMAFTFTGCYEQVPAGTKGKILGESGWQPEVYPPSRVWLTELLTQTPEKMYLMQTTTKKYSQPIKVLLADKLTLEATVVFRGRIAGTDDVVNALFNDLEMNDNIVTTDEVYNVYGRMIVLNTAREVLSKYNIDNINTNYKRITVELFQAIQPKLKGLPIEISDVTIGNIKYPQIVTDAIEQAKERRMAIEKAAAQAQIDVKKAEGREAVAKANYRVKMLEAKQIRDYNKMINAGITDDLIRLKEIEVQQTLADNTADNKNVIYMPLPMMDGATHMRTLK